MALSGFLHKFVADKGFGFIRKADGGDVFVHVRQVIGGGPEDLIQGAQMTFDVAKNPRNGKMQVINVRVKTSEASSIVSTCFCWTLRVYGLVT